MINENRGPQRGKDGKEKERVPSEAPLSRNSDSNIAIVKGAHLLRIWKNHLVGTIEEELKLLCVTLWKKIFENTDIRVWRNSMVVVGFFRKLEGKNKDD